MSEKEEDGWDSAIATLEEIARWDWLATASLPIGQDILPVLEALEDLGIQVTVRKALTTESGRIGLIVVIRR